MSHTLPAVSAAARPASVLRRGHAAARTLALAPVVAMLAAACSDVASAPKAATTTPSAESSADFTSLPEGLTESEIRAHVIAPKHLQGVRMEENDPAREINLPAFAAPSLDRQAVPGATTAVVPTFNYTTFGNYVHKALKDSVAGYMMQIRQNGTLTWTAQWNWAQTPSDLGTGWNQNRRMHVASVSKFLTAVGLVKSLDAHGISYDAKIVNYLPTYWTKGSNVGLITFRQLLTHTSGFSGNGSASDYSTMKANVANGVSAAAIGTYAYQNLNFGLMRILMPIINGQISKSASFSFLPFLNDLSWDSATLSDYKSFMQLKVFTPAGVANASFAPIYNGSNVLAYKASYALNHDDGWDSGDLSSVAGGAGWRLSTNELLNVMNHVRRMHTIIPASTAQYMLDNYFGIDQKIYTGAGYIYNKNGAWTSGGKMEQAVAYFLPNGMELALFVDSPIGNTGFSLRGLVKDAYVASLTY